MQKGHHRMCGKPQRVNKMLGLSHNGEAKKTAACAAAAAAFLQNWKRKGEIDGS
jgi:hypothetical protein